MYRQDPPGSWKQLSLAFNPNANPEGTAILRLAYGQLKLSQHLSFELAMSDRAMAIGIRHLADAITRHRMPGAEKKINGMDAGLAFRSGPIPSDVERGDG